MDIAKYAGLFFLRNEFLYLPGIGNLEVRKTAPVFNKENSMLEPGSKEIVFKAMTGVIEDSLSNFIASNERISIAAATNHIRDFATNAKHQLANNQSVEIPGVGNFVKKDDLIWFESLQNIEYNPKPVKTFKNSELLEERKEKDIKQIYKETQFKTPTSDDQIVLEKPRINYGKIVILALLGLLLLSGIGYLIYYFANQPKQEQTNTDNSVDESKMTPTTQENAIIDSQNVASDSVSNIPPSSGNYNIIVNQYGDKAAAENREKVLKSYGWVTNVVAQDSITYLVTVSLPVTATPQQQVVDSVKKILNPKFDVRILNQ